MLKVVVKFIIIYSILINVLFAETIELDQGIKINIPKGYEYLQFNQLELMKLNFEMMEVPKDKSDEMLDQLKSIYGEDISATSTIIGKKGYAKGYGDMINHELSGNTDFWTGWETYEEKCGNKDITDKKTMKCLIKFFKMDPLIQIDIGNNTTEFLKELSIEMDNNKIDNTNKPPEKVKNVFSKLYQNEMNVKLVKLKNNQSAIELLGEDTVMGFKSKRIGYMFLHNERAFIIQGFCMSQATCKNIKKLNNKILEPYLSMNLMNKRTVNNISKDDNLTEQLKNLNELYKSGALTKEEFAKAKKRLLN